MRMRLTDTVLNERNQTQKAMYLWFHLYEMSREGNFRSIEEISGF